MKEKPTNFKNFHYGHRKRLREAFLKNPAGLYDHQLLELLLFYALPRADVNPLAHRLLQKFGSLSGVFQAKKEDLFGVPGVGEGVACLLLALGELWRRLHHCAARQTKTLAFFEQAAERAHFYLDDAKKEQLYLFCLDSNYHLLHVSLIAEGSSAALSLSPQKIARLALQGQATKIILAHNHPGGKCHPSRADIEATMALLSPLRALGIELADHIILGQDGDYSFAHAGAIPPAPDETPLKKLHQYAKIDPPQNPLLQ